MYSSIMGDTERPQATQAHRPQPFTSSCVGDICSWSIHSDRNSFCSFCCYTPYRKQLLFSVLGEVRLLKSVSGYQNHFGQSLAMGVYSTAQTLLPRSRIHERTISLRFLGIMLRVLRLEVYITNQYQTTFARWGGGGGGVKSTRIGHCE